MFIPVSIYPSILVSFCSFYSFYPSFLLSCYPSFFLSFCHRILLSHYASILVSFYLQSNYSCIILFFYHSIILSFYPLSYNPSIIFVLLFFYLHIPLSFYPRILLFFYPSIKWIGIDGLEDIYIFTFPNFYGLNPFFWGGGLITQKRLRVST